MKMVRKHILRKRLHLKKKYFALFLTLVCPQVLRGTEGPVWPDSLPERATISLYLLVLLPKNMDSNYSLDIKLDFCPSPWHKT